jgi:hypothetical protein
MHPMLYRFTASGVTPADAFAGYAAEDGLRPQDLMHRRADLAKVKGVAVIEDRAPLRSIAVGYFNDSYCAFSGADGTPLSEDDAEWLADRLIEDDDARIPAGVAGALLLDASPDPAPTWLFFGWAVPTQMT